MKIEETVEICAKAVEQVSQPWEYLIDDEELKKVMEQFHIAKEEASQLESEVKKLLIVEKMEKATDMKKLEQQVPKLCTHQQKRTN